MSLASQLRGRAAARAPATGSSAVLHTTPTPTVRPGPPPSGPPQQQQRHSDFRPQRTHRRHFNFPQRKGRPPSPPPQFRPDKLALRQVGVLPPTVQPEEVQPLKTGLAVTWLGTSSGTPTIERNVSCTVVRAPGHTYLVDCGEGTHRQLPTVDFDMHTIHSIFITHLHGDHCYGLGTTLLAVDEAKAHAQSKAIPHNSASPKANDSSLTGAQEKNQEQQQQQQPQQEEPTIYVYGPPGLAELLRAQLVITGSHHAFHSRVLVTELVTNPKDAITTPQPIGPSSSRLHFCRLPPQNMQDQPSLKAASDVLAPRLSQLQTIWRPYNPFKHLPPHQRPRNDPPEPPSLEQSFDGRNFVAAEGLFWDLPSGPMRVMAAQLQHRVPCWGYVLRESRSYAPGMKKRKVTILGDTVNSKAIAPLSLGTDMLAHEATFIEGMEQKCRVAQHSTGWMAGEFAWAVHAKALVLTHFSARYNAWKKGPKGGNDGDDGESAEQEVAMQNSAIRALLAETRSRYRQGNLMAASDFFTFHVPFKVWPPVGQPLRKAAPQSPPPPSTRQQKVSELAS